MDMSTYWWVAAGILLGLEMLSGTFYLLMLALGVAAAALTAHAGWGLQAQIVTAAVVGLVAVGVWHQVRRQQRPALQDNNLDIGESVQVQAWAPDGQTQVRYRGTQWQAVLQAGAACRPGPHRVVSLEGNRLVLVPL
jgi:membrane protein implicated in regulation of membrane protease activity